MFNNVSIKNRLILLSVTPIVLLIGLLLLLMSELRFTEQGAERIYNDRVVPLEDLKLIADDYAVFVIDAINKANAGLISVEEASAGIKNSEHEIDITWEKYIATTLTPKEEKLVAEAEELFKDANAALRMVHIELAKFSGNAQGQLNAIDGPLYKSIDPISEKITELVNLQLEVAGDERDEIVEVYNWNMIFLPSLAAVLVLILVVLGVLVYRSLILPLNNIRNTIETIIGDLDLTHEVKVDGKNELGDITISFNNMIGQMRDMVGHVSDSAMKLSNSATQMTQISISANNSIDTQRDEIQQVATAMNEMVATAQEISRNAEAADSGARDTSEEAKQGNLIVSEAVQATNDLVVDVKSVSERIKNLGK